MERIGVCEQLVASSVFLELVEDGEQGCITRVGATGVWALTSVPRSEGCCATARSALHAHSSPTRTDARGESRTLMGLPPTDFESVASAIPPLGRGAKYNRGGWLRFLAVALGGPAAAIPTQWQRRRDTMNLPSRAAPARRARRPPASPTERPCGPENAPG